MVLKLEFNHCKFALHFYDTNINGVVAQLVRASDS